MTTTTTSKPVFMGRIWKEEATTLYELETQIAELVHQCGKEIEKLRGDNFDGVASELFSLLEQFPSAGLKAIEAHGYAQKEALQ